MSLAIRVEYLTEIRIHITENPKLLSNFGIRSLGKVWFNICLIRLAGLTLFCWVQYHVNSMLCAHSLEHHECPVRRQPLCNREPYCSLLFAPKLYKVHSIGAYILVVAPPSMGRGQTPIECRMQDAGDRILFCIYIYNLYSIFCIPHSIYFFLYSISLNFIFGILVFNTPR